LAALESGETNFSMDPSLSVFQRLPRPCLPIGATPRSLARIARRAADAARRGPASLSIYGHPMVFEPFCQEAVAACVERGLACEVVAGTSSIDALLSCLKAPLEGGGLLACSLRYALESPLDPRAWTLIFKACEDPPRLAALTRKLLSLYPRRQQVALVRAGGEGGPDVVWAPLRLLPRAAERVEVYRSVVVAPAGRRLG
jgi:uncharacterized protein YabN with tetrapyrrole methylase and pyrophosphatase domain